MFEAVRHLSLFVFNIGSGNELNWRNHTDRLVNPESHHCCSGWWKSWINPGKVSVQREPM